MFAKKWLPFPRLFSRRYIRDYKIFDKLKEKNENHRDTHEVFFSNENNNNDKVEIINIDEKILEKTNVFRKEDTEQQRQEDQDVMKEEEFYDNMKSFKNVDIKSFIQETIDYYTSKQLNAKQWELSEKQHHVSSNKQHLTWKEKKEIPQLSNSLADFTVKWNKQEGRGKVENEKRIIQTNDSTRNYGEKDNKLAWKEIHQENKKNSEQHTSDDKYHGMTPAQRFYEENKEKLIYESMKYYNERRKKLSGGNGQLGGSVQKEDAAKAETEEEAANEETEKDYYYSQVTDPIVRPKDNYLFDYENGENDERSENECEGEENVELEKGIMPTIEQVVFILKHEKVKNIKVIDLDKCGRRDIGMFLILCTGQTPKHNKRVGKLISKIFVDLEIPYISKVVYCYCNKFDDWIIAHCGPLKIHIVTKELRDIYDLENLFLFPHEHFDSKNFPSFFDYTPGIPPPYIVRSNSTLDAYQNDELYQKFIADT
ncbi:hypothetical protein, conserved [Plasmodium gonderi]|uniref:Ribosomal silencing factor RsfS n=1 Tax=Plasmodium gonderi TaxID=77519 RepID=A0A1Y1JFC2_PLAGO|nr:hypothetical protein, conserved [Plasmodium gonderi]GAW79907.1 hypothetical protein, conserved [Plasmodium gonderi]